MGSKEDAAAVLVVDDQVGEIRWLMDRLEDRGYEIVLVTNEADGQKMLDEAKAGGRTFQAAIFDVMMATKDVWALLEAGEDLDDQFYDDSKDSGLRLCRHARQKLDLTAEELPIACLTVRDDEALKKELRKLEIPLYSRLREPGGSDIMDFVDEYLPA